MSDQTPQQPPVPPHQPPPNQPPPNQPVPQQPVPQQPVPQQPVPPVQQQPPYPPQQQPYPPQQGYAPQPGYPPQQGYPPQPGYAPQPGYPQPPYPRPAAPAGGLFKSGKQKTIALIAGGVVAVGLLGGLVAVVAGGDDGSSKPEVGSVNSGVLDPKPVGQVDGPQDPGTDPSASPTPTPAPSESPQPTPTPEPPPASGAVTVGSVDVMLSGDWALTGDPGSDSALFADGHGSYITVLTGVVDPTDDAGSLLANNVDFFVGGENYSDVSVDQVSPIDPFGSIVSGAVTNYTATWVDSQGSIPLQGAIWAAVRQDGTALLMSAEHGPAGQWDKSADSWGPVIDATFNQFGAS